MLNWLIKLFKKKSVPEKEAPQQNKANDKQKASACLDEFTKLFAGDDTFVTRPFKCGDHQCCLACIDGMVNNEVINMQIILPLTTKSPPKGTDIKQWIEEYGVSINEMKHLTQIDLMLDAILSGDSILFVQGMDGAFGLNTKGFATRAILEPDMEKVSRGSHDGFTENIVTNLSMIRRRLKTPDMKINFRLLGKRTNTKVCLCYLDSLVDKKVLDDLNRRLDKINIDGMLASNYIEELISDSRMSIFSTINYTERPDTAVGKMLEGRIAIVVDNMPVVLIVPFLFIEYFHTSTDYFENFYAGSIGRFLRILGFLLTIMVPSLYLALVTLHQEMIPSGLLAAINAARQQVPLPTIVEVIVLLVTFDLLRESSAHLPTNLGQSLSIVGGLVIGQAAVQARLVSAPVVIIVALTGITGLIIPKFNMPAIVLRIVFLFLANFFGLYGVAFGLTGLLLHLLGKQSFGVPYMQGIMPKSLQQAKDTYIRAPWWTMILRPTKISMQDAVRQSVDKSEESNEKNS